MWSINYGTILTVKKSAYAIKTPENLSPRIQWLRDYYFSGVQRPWNNEATSWTTGTPWDFQYEEFNFYIVPETYAFFPTFRGALSRLPARSTCTRISGSGPFLSAKPGF
jgi:hypothetical protein